MSAIETVEIPRNESKEAFAGAVLVACQSAEINSAEIAVQANTSEDPVRRSLALLDRIEVSARDGRRFIVTLLRCIISRTIEDEPIGTGVVVRVEELTGGSDS